MKLLSNLLIAFSLLSAEGFAQEYKLIWSDEFNGTALDLTKWSCEIGNGSSGWGNNELEYYTSRPQNCAVDSGYLTITALKESYSGFNYTSARINTQNKFSFEYGKVEARIKLPYGKGMWPAFWMLGDNISSVGWPACGENDIMEMIGGKGTGGLYSSPLSDATAYGTLHWYQNGSTQAGSHYSLASGKFADGFHLFGTIWTSSEIQFYVDSTIYYTKDISATTLSAFRNKFYIILNLAVGGNWPGYPDSTTVFPQTMQVDYVRVYQDTSQTSVGLAPLPNVANELALSQNFPNPFNPSTVISYQLPASSRVTLKIYDSLGRQVASLVSGRQNAGFHSVTFDGAKLPSGVYLCQLAVAGAQEVRKMVLIK